MKILVVFLLGFFLVPFALVGVWALAVFWVQDWSPKARLRKREDEEFWRTIGQAVDWEERYWDLRWRSEKLGS